MQYKKYMFTLYYPTKCAVLLFVLFWCASGPCQAGQEIT